MRVIRSVDGSVNAKKNDLFRAWVQKQLLLFPERLNNLISFKNIRTLTFNMKLTSGYSALAVAIVTL
jgi:hypothetical protein